MTDGPDPKLRRMEMEASLFAMELLMPRDWLLADLKKLGSFDVENDQAAIKNLAKRYRVSEQTMTIRIGQVLAL